jgi:thiol-disulfide isomerase/thioredoxin
MSFLLSLLLALSVHAAEINAEPCDDAGQVYRVCSDQAQTFQAALNSAQEKKKNLLVEFGAEWCAWCHSLHKLFHDPAQEKNWASMSALFEVGLYNGREKSPSGQKVLEQVMAFAGETKEPAGIPILALIDPAKKKAVIIDTEPLEHNVGKNKGHDPKKVFKALQAAAKKLRQMK